MPRPVPQSEVNSGRSFAAPPRLHWAVLLLLILAGEALVSLLIPEPYRNFAIYAVAAAWPTYLCIWIRRIDSRASSLYWAVASLVTGVGFLFSWLLWIVVIYELREELLEHYNRREPIGLELNWLFSLLGSFIYFQHALNKIAKEKDLVSQPIAVESEGSVPA